MRVLTHYSYICSIELNEEEEVPEGESSNNEISPDKSRRSNVAVTQASALQRASGSIAIATSGAKLGSVVLGSPCARDRSSRSDTSNRSSTKTLQGTVLGAGLNSICGQPSNTPLSGRRESRSSTLFGRVGFSGGANHKASMHCDAAARDRHKVSNSNYSE